MFKVNKEKCLGCGACVSTCKEVYDIDTDGLAKVIAQPTEETLKAATEAKENCPTDAIEIVEE